MKIAYLHGLERKLSGEKRLVLETFGQVWAPEIKYQQPKMLSSLLEDAPFEPDAVIGSSMGGYAAYFLSRCWSCDALLFNPAFVNRPFDPDLTGLYYPEDEHPFMQVILGQVDDVIPAELNQAYIEANLSVDDIDIFVRAGLGHRIPLPVFEEEVTAFLEY
ncbi:MAG: hypothetical protein IPI60_07700 [Saprospiraceae bacterium]|jgi:hypothetical protein|nr:hypothetical protein [Saprospiraceae bacterium]